jgi:hypothetical protein
MKRGAIRHKRQTLLDFKDNSGADEVAACIEANAISHSRLSMTQDVYSLPTATWG